MDEIGSAQKRPPIALGVELWCWAALLIGLSAGYCVLVWYAMGMFRSVLDVASLPRLSAILLYEGLSASWQALHWQLLVGASALMVLTGRPRSGRDHLSAHVALLTGLCFWQAAAARMPFFAIACSFD